LDKLISNNININRYDVSKVIYILYYHQWYEYKKEWYYLPKDTIDKKIK
jgi:hypothetical protein